MIENMEQQDWRQFWTVENFAKVLNAPITKSPDDLKKNDAPITGVSIDTRTLKKGEAFIAIEGPNFDGNKFVNQAFEKGASLAVVSKDISRASGTILKLDNNLQNGTSALKKLASQWRNHLQIASTMVIAVAGSNGKTTTRRLIHQTLSSAYCPLLDKKLQGTQSQASFNNNIGVALTLLKTPAQSDFVVTEIGTNHPGEIAELAQLVKPHIAIITSIGQEHLEFFGDIEAVAKEEASLLWAIENGELKIENEKESIFRRKLLADKPAFVEAEALCAIKKYCSLPDGLNVISYSTPESEPAPLGQEITLSNNTKFTLPLFGKHNSANAGAAIALGQYLGIDDNTIASNLSKAAPAPGRFEIIAKGATVFINDAYNANPDSMAASLNTFCALPAPGGKTIILGDMLELGEKAPKLHEQIGEHIASLINGGNNFKNIFLIGELAKHIAAGLVRMAGETPAPPGETPAPPGETPDPPDDRPTKRVNIQTYPRLDEKIITAINSQLDSGDLVLLKASRGMKLEKIIKN